MIENISSNKKAAVVLKNKDLKSKVRNINLKLIVISIKINSGWAIRILTGNISPCSFLLGWAFNRPCKPPFSWFLGGYHECGLLHTHHAKARRKYSVSVWMELHDYE